MFQDVTAPELAQAMTDAAFLILGGRSRSGVCPFDKPHIGGQVCQKCLDMAKSDAARLATSAKVA